MYHGSFHWLVCRWTQRVGPMWRAERHQRAGMRFALTGADQCVASLSNFAVGVAIARIAGIAALGAYSLAYIAWLALADIHRSLVTDPMAIENDLRGPGAKDAVRAGLAAELVLGVGLGAVVAGIGAILLAAGQDAYGVSFVALAPWLPFLLVQDYWRWVAFMKAAPGRALANDVVFDVVQAGAFGILFILGVRSSVLAIGAWGVGALLGAAFGLWQHSVIPGCRGGIGLLQRRWHLSKWLLGGSITTWGASQAYVVLTGVMLGPAGIGGLRAALSLVTGPSVVLLQAGGSVGLPEASKALKERGWKGLQRVQRLITAAGVLSVAAVGAVVLVFGRQLLTLLYGHQFARFAPTADVLALSVMLGALSLGAVLSLKVTKLTGKLFHKSLMSLTVSVIAVIVLVPIFGVIGAAGAAVARSFTSSTVTLGLHWRYSRSAADSLVPSGALTTEGSDDEPAPVAPLPMAS